MEFLTRALAFVALLGVIIFVHEFGHFATAKAFGMRVFIFSFGFGRRLFGFKWGDTDCRVSLIPLGGYVKLEGEPDDRLSEDVSAAGDGRDFTARPRWQRFLVYVAGPVMNGVLTLAVLTVLYMRGLGVDATLHDPPVIGAVEVGSPAEAAGLAPGDRILAVDGRRLDTWEQARYAILLRPDTSLTLRVQRGEEARDVPLRSTSRTADQVGHIGVFPLFRVGEVVDGKPAQAAGIQTDDGILDIDGRPVRSFDDLVTAVGSSGGKTLAFRVTRGGRTLEVPVTPRDDGEGLKVGLGPKLVVMRYGLSGAVSESLSWMWTNTKLTGATLQRLVTGQLSIKAVSGPLGIARISGDAARQGASTFFFVVAVISLQVGLLNLFPLVPLDGGHLAILAAEGTLRRDLTPAVKGWIMNAGAVVILLLVGVVLYSDFAKTGWFGK